MGGAVRLRTTLADASEDVERVFENFRRHVREMVLQVVDLGTLPGASSSWASGINDRGWVVGEADMGNTTCHGFLWRRGRRTDSPSARL